MRGYLLCAASAVLALVAASPAAAQLGGLSVGAAYGSSRLSGGRSGDFAAGWHGEALADVSLPLLPLGLRAELAYDHLANKPGATATEALNVASGVINATFSVPFPVLHPYAIAGIGYYHRNGAFGGSGESKAGFNGGVGVELWLPVIRPFVEARYHSIAFSGSSAHLIPLTVGVIF